MRKRISMALLGFRIVCLAGSLSAAEGRFQLVKTPINLPEFPPSTAFTLLTDKHEITFIPPGDGMVINDSSKQEVRITFRDDRCLIILRPGNLSPALASADSWEGLRGMVQERFPGAEISAGSACFNSIASGCCFTIKRRTIYNTRLTTRLCFVPYQDGMLEVSLTAADARFPAQLFTLNSFLNCLRLGKKDPRNP